jgi:ribose 5-phosphate isomerase B
VIWYAGSDHAGVRLKSALVEVLKALGDQVVDLGTDSPDRSVDYSDFGALVGNEVVKNPGTLGLAICGSGIGISIAANRIAGVRAARCTDEYSARMAREHNDANVLCLGERVTGVGLAESILKAFRDGSFAGGRHAGRVAKLK